MFHYGAKIRLLHSCISQKVTDALSETELTSAQGRIMGYLTHCDTPPCPKDVEESFHLTHPTVSGLLSRMEKKGFISLQEDPDDRRCKRIHILPKGRQIDEHIHNIIMKNEEQIVSGFTEEEKQIFAQLLTRAAQNLGGEKCCIPEKEETTK